MLIKKEEEKKKMDDESESFLLPREDEVNDRRSWRMFLHAFLCLFMLAKFIAACWILSSSVPSIVRAIYNGMIDS